MTHRSIRAERWSVAALLWCVLALVGAWLPLGSMTSVDSAGVVTRSHPSLIQHEGLSVLVVFLVPIAITAVPVFTRHHRASQQARVVAAVLVGVGVLLALASVGIFFVPALVSCLAAAAIGRSSRPVARAV